MATDRYDIIIIGTGAGGGTLAYRLPAHSSRFETGRERPHVNDRLRWHRMTDLHVVILIRPGTCPWRVGAAFAAVLVALLAFAFPALAAVIKIDRISVTVSDLARTEKFYRDALGFETVRRGRQDDPSFAHLLGVEGASF